MINYFTEGVDFDREDFHKITDWIERVTKKEGYLIDNVNYIFCNDDYLLKINQEFLDHDYYTDIITFPFSEKHSKELCADIYISLERVEQNSKDLQQDFKNELKRVIIHGILHLIGYDDSTVELKRQMREKEDFYIKLY